MKKFSENDIEKMLSKIEKTDAQFDLGVRFPNTVIRPRRRFASLLVAACLAVLVVSSAVIVAFVQNDSYMTEYSTSGDNLQSNSNYSEGQDVSDLNSVGNEESFPFDNSNDMSNNSASDDVTRDPLGDTDVSGEGSNSNEDVSDEKPVLPDVVYPDENELFVNNNIGSLTPDEYFASNPIRNLLGVKELTLYNRSPISVEERKNTINLIGESLGISLIFDEDLFKITGDCRGYNNKTKFSVNVGEYGDWFIYLNNERLLQFNIYNGEISNEIQTKIKSFVKSNSKVFPDEGYKYSFEYEDDKLDVRISVDSDDEVLSNIPKFTLTFKKMAGNQYSLFSIESNTTNMTSIGDYPLRSYSQALEDFFKMEITEDNYPDSSEDYDVGFTYVGHDVRYLSNSKSDCMYPYYAFVIQFGPYGEEARYKAFFVPAVDAEYLEITE